MVHGQIGKEPDGWRVQEQRFVYPEGEKVVSVKSYNDASQSAILFGNQWVCGELAFYLYGDARNHKVNLISTLSEKLIGFAQEVTIDSPQLVIGH